MSNKNLKYLFFFIFFKVLPSQSQQLTRNPYLQQPTENSIIIRWRTDVPASSKITYSKVGQNRNFEKIDATPKTEHIIQITGLEADTKYLYSVGTIEKELLKTNFHYFSTAPKADTKRPIRLWAMGDFGDLSTEKYIQNQTNVRNQFLKNRKGQTDLWLWLGDNAYCCGTDAEYQRQVFDFYGNEIFGNIPIMPSPGNHEYYATETGKIDRKIPYFDMISVPTNGEAGGVPSGNKAYYSYNYGNIHFISLDSYGYDDGKFPLADKRSQQYKWLENDLKNDKSLWKIVYFHHPPYTKRSHDSDAEEDLKAIRENIVLLLESYKVDLVLSGHSHVYERSYLMRSHVGISDFFVKNVFVLQDTEANYTKTSKPIINKDEGTMYMVIGSAGRLDWNGQTKPHPSSVYSNYEIGGSLSLTIDENRLDGEWICSDGVIRDKFTVFKNVNKTQKNTIEFGSKINLTASWEGTHRWSNGIINQQSIEISPRKDTVLTVTDSLGYLIDKFEITVLPQPKISTLIASNQSICAGKEVKINFDLKNTTSEKWTFSLELSDKNGSFAKPIILEKANKTAFSVILPDTLSESEKYRFRVRANGEFFEEIPTDFIKINQPAEVRFLNESTIPFEPEILLKVQTKGTLPISLTINDLPEKNIDKILSEILVKQSKSVIYSIEKASNTCGSAKVLGNKITVLEPLITEEKYQNFTIYPNPTTNIIFIKNDVDKNTKTKITLRDLDGKKISEKQTNFEEKEAISLENLPAGFYLLEIKSNKVSFTKKIIKH